VKELVKLADTGGENAKDALAVLKRLKGQGVPEAIATELAAAKGPLRDLLMEAAAVQPVKESLVTLTGIAVNEPGDARNKALDALATGGTPNDVPELLKQAAKFPDETSRKAFYKTIEKLLAKQPNHDDRAKVLGAALQGAPAAVRPAIFRLLGACGSSDANIVLAKEITAGGDRRKSALDALKTWNTPNATLADAILEAAQAGDRDVLTGAYCRTVTRVPSMTGAEIVAGLRKAVPLADNGKAREEFVAALGTLGSREAADFAAELAGGADAVIAAVVKPVVVKITTQAGQASTLIAGDNVLDGRDAVIISDGKDAEYSSTVRYVTGWRSPHTRIAWDVVIASPVTVEIEILQSALRKEHSYFFSAGNVSVEKEVTVTKNTDDFARVNLGKFTLSRAGSWRLWLEPGRMTENEALLNVRNLTVRVE